MAKYIHIFTPPLRGRQKVLSAKCHDFFKPTSSVQLSFFHIHNPFQTQTPVSETLDITFR